MRFKLVCTNNQSWALPGASLDLKQRAKQTEKSRKTEKSNLSIIFPAASGIARTHRRTSRTTRTGSKRRSTCCSAVRPSRQRSEASEEVEGRVGGWWWWWWCGGINIIFLISNLCSNRFKLFWEVFDKVCKVCFFSHGGEECFVL